MIWRRRYCKNGIVQIRCKNGIIQRWRGNGIMAVIDFERADHMDCEVCGAEEAQFVTIIEGARLKTCSVCAHMGRIVAAPTAPRPANPDFGNVGSGPGMDAMARGEQAFELVEGYGQVIAEARQRMRLPLAVVAEKLSEKESYLERIEHEKARPMPELARRIEKELGVKIIDHDGAGQVSGEGSGKPNFKGPVTLGDILELELKKKAGKK